MGQFEAFPFTFSKKKKWEIWRNVRTVPYYKLIEVLAHFQRQNLVIVTNE
jgi:hypothetical protein